MGRQVRRNVRVAIVPNREEDTVLIRRGNRVGVLSILVHHGLSAHLYAHVTSRDAQGHQVGIDGRVLLWHKHFLIAPLVRLVLRSIWSRRMAEPEVRGRRWEAAQMGIKNRSAAIAFKLETNETADEVVAVRRLYLHTIPRVGRELHLGNDFERRV